MGFRIGEDDRRAGVIREEGKGCGRGEGGVGQLSLHRLNGNPLTRGV